MNILLLFIDGFGIGGDDGETNPFIDAKTPNLDKIRENHIVVPTDATLGVEGIPQSASGQTTLLTGINGPKALGHHLNGFPTPTLKKILMEHSVFKQLKDKGYKVTNANAYTTEYLTYMGKIKGVKWGISATTVATMAADIPFRVEEELINKKAVYQDIINEVMIHEWQIPAESLTPHEAGGILAKIVADHHFTLFEYFQTDIAGHRQNKEKAIEIIERLDQFIGGILDKINLEETLVIITSDHGNIEDLSIKTHTMNPVPTMLVGKSAEVIKDDIKDLTDITPAIVKVLEKSQD
ncbi:alkaline phosphatase family protein [Alkaliphilus hydrothermalis]|uniref:Phosphopentomutase n=1 Tax=Alkaliphilus hydrothermalis TaxID=1482730 RepID=A0ABS2NSJ5_9FIRM|nr:alkaline phosphatase family protein [Alkaliphilus hydrothermalis]MBM7615934.1 phosphopentomutase [Alkaliphilus hydrothermalis]